MGCHFFLQRVFPTHISCVSAIGRQILYHSRHLGGPKDGKFTSICYLPLTVQESRVAFQLLTQKRKIEEEGGVRLQSLPRKQRLGGIQAKLCACCRSYWAIHGHDASFCICFLGESGQNSDEEISEMLLE